MDDKISAMLDIGFILLEAEDWKKAEQIFDKILDAEPHSSDAFLGKSMAELHITDKKSIAQYGKKILKNINFKLAVRFADDSQKKSLQNIEKDINTTILQKKAKSKKLKKIIVKVSIVSIICCSVVIGSIIGYDKIISPMVQYNQAQRLLDSGNYKEAISKFQELDSYKESQEKIYEALYQQANYYLTKADYEKAFENLEKIINYKDSQTIYNEEVYNYAVKLFNDGDFAKCANYFLKVKDYKDSDSYLKKQEVYWRTKGNIVTFGKYEQDDNNSNRKEAIEWIVLDPKLSQNTVLLISKLCLDYKMYDNGNYGLDSDGNYDVRNDSGVNWLNCSLRSWLNSTFYNNSFTGIEKSKIKPTKISYEFFERKEITDNVSILSSDEAKKYFDETVQMSTGETKYAYQNLSRTYYDNKPRYSKYSEKYVIDYWLRSLDRKVAQDEVISSSTVANANVIEDKGEICENGAMYSSPVVAVRPIISVLVH